MFPSYEVVLPRVRQRGGFYVNIFRRGVGPRYLVQSRPQVRQSGHGVSQLIHGLASLIPRDTFLFTICGFSRVFRLPIIWVSYVRSARPARVRVGYRSYVNERGNLSL